MGVKPPPLKPWTLNFVSKILLGSCLNTRCLNLRREDCVFSIGIREANFHHILVVVYEVKAKLSITWPIPFKCCEDKPSSIPLAIWNRRLDILDKFCGNESESRDGKHQCFVDVNPSPTLWKNIKETLEIMEIGFMCRVLVVNPLVVAIPCFFAFCL